MVARRGDTEDLDDERVHELCAALLGIEASAAGLSRHRAQLTERQLDELAQGLLAEVRRVRTMLRGCPDAPTAFDLRECIAPLVACAAASGLDIRCSIPAGTTIVGNRDAVAQVVVALLDNARRHAPSSPVRIRAKVSEHAVDVFVEDRGCGVADLATERVFERGVHGRDSTGSGLGLFISRRLMAEQGGSIAVRARRGGGTSFALRFRGPTPR